jgi:hypothetical protein
MEKNSDPGWKKFGSRIRDGKNSDPGWKKFESGINIPDPHHCTYLGCPGTDGREVVEEHSHAVEVTAPGRLVKRHPLAHLP